MADLVVSNQGEAWALRRMLRRSNADDADAKLRVFVNDYTPNRDSVLADLVEASWSGYAPLTLLADTWTDPASVAGAAESRYGASPVLFTPVSGVIVAYGAFVTNNAGDVLLWSFRFDSPQTVTSSAPCVVPVSFMARSESEPAPP